MVNTKEWKSDRKRYEAAWAKYQNVAERVEAAYESLDSGTQDQAPADEDLAELQEAWKELETARERLGVSVHSETSCRPTEFHPTVASHFPKKRLLP